MKSNIATRRTQVDAETNGRHNFEALHIFLWTHRVTSQYLSGFWLISPRMVMLRPGLSPPCTSPLKGTRCSQTQSGVKLSTVLSQKVEVKTPMMQQEPTRSLGRLLTGCCRTRRQKKSTCDLFTQQNIDTFHSVACYLCFWLLTSWTGFDRILQSTCDQFNPT